jgi:hypothetical protein
MQGEGIYCALLEGEESGVAGASPEKPKTSDNSQCSEVSFPVGEQNGNLFIPGLYRTSYWRFQTRSARAPYAGSSGEG